MPGPSTASAIRIDPEALLTEKQAADLLNFTPRFLEGRRRRGDGPAFVRISSCAIRYRRTDLREWIAARVETPSTKA